MLLDILLPFVVPDDSTTTVRQATREQFHLNVILTTLSGVSLLMALAYFPNLPEHSPSASAEASRDDQEKVGIA